MYNTKNFVILIFSSSWRFKNVTWRRLLLIIFFIFCVCKILTWQFLRNSLIKSQMTEIILKNIFQINRLQKFGAKLRISFDPLGLMIFEFLKILVFFQFDFFWSKVKNIIQLWEFFFIAKILDFWDSKVSILTKWNMTGVAKWHFRAFKNTKLMRNALHSPL